MMADTSTEAVKRIADCVNTLQISGERVDREYLDMAPGVLRALRAALDAAEAENKRLREALDYIANGAGEYRSDEIGKAAMDVARAALQEKTDD